MSFWEIAEITVFWKFSSSLFLYSERTIASTETNDTSEGSSDTQLFGAGKSGGVALSGGLHAHLPQKDIEKKSKFDGGNSGCKKNVPILFLYYGVIVCPLLWITRFILGLH